MTDTRTETEKRLYEMAEKFWRDYDGSSVPTPLFDLWREVNRLCAPPKPRRVEGWVNVYPDGRAFYKSREDADVMAGTRRIACIYVSGEEGKGPGE